MEGRRLFSSARELEPPLQVLHPCSGHPVASYCSLGRVSFVLQLKHFIELQRLSFYYTIPIPEKELENKH